MNLFIFSLSLSLPPFEWLKIVHLKHSSCIPIRHSFPDLKGHLHAIGLNRFVFTCKSVKCPFVQNLHERIYIDQKQRSIYEFRTHAHTLTGRCIWNVSIELCRQDEDKVHRQMKLNVLPQTGHIECKTTRRIATNNSRKKILIMQSWSERGRWGTERGRESEQRWATRRKKGRQQQDEKKNYDRLIVVNNTEKYTEMKPKMNVSESEIEQECNAEKRTHIDVGQCWELLLPACVSPEAAESSSQEQLYCT